MEFNSEPDKELAEKWPGWPGYTVFRFVVPSEKFAVFKNGAFLKKLSEETRATYRVIDGPITSLDRVILISAKEEPEAALSPAMNAIIRIFKLVNGLIETDGNATASAAAAGTAPCLTRLLVPSTQGFSLIGKGGCMVKFIQEGCGAKLRILPPVELPIYADSDERIVELQGETVKVLNALEAVLKVLRKFLVDQSILPLFEKTYNELAVTQERQVDGQAEEPVTPAAPQISLGDDCPPCTKKDSDFRGRESAVEPQNPSRPELYIYDDRPCSPIGIRAGPLVPQVAHTMRVTMACAEDIIGNHGCNIDFIRNNSGADIKLQYRVALPDEMTVVIKGTSQQVQIAKELIHAFTGDQTDPFVGKDGDNSSNSDQILFSQTKK